MPRGINGFDSTPEENAGNDVVETSLGIAQKRAFFKMRSIADAISRQRRCIHEFEECSSDQGLSNYFDRKTRVIF